MQDQTQISQSRERCDVINFFKKHFSDLAKISLLLYSACLSTAYYAGTFLYDKELRALEAKLQVEELIGKRFESIDCAKLKEHFGKCHFVERQFELFDSVSNHVDLLWRLFFGLGFIFLLLSVFGAVYALRNETPHHKTLPSS